MRAPGSIPAQAAACDAVRGRAGIPDIPAMDEAPVAHGSFAHVPFR